MVLRSGRLHREITSHQRLFMFQVLNQVKTDLEAQNLESSAVSARLILN